MSDMQQFVARSPLEVGDVVEAQLPDFPAPTCHVVTDILLVQSARTCACWFLYELDRWYMAKVDRIRCRVTDAGPVPLGEEATACRKVWP